jgi:predicted amidophosphoribosyltransferase
VLLVDDVFTTGATLDAATRTLLDGGVTEVRVAAVARAW